VFEVVHFLGITFADLFFLPNLFCMKVSVTKRIKHIIDFTVNSGVLHEIEYDCDFINIKL